ncbi:MAG: hypothetical protein E6Q97_13200 [Desulfurellales bacterium]|nr:MAG: hypothetical protein E6Q97_13200 [Desulfurellales bacterium]
MLDQATTLDQLCALRATVGAPAFVSRIKKKSAEVASTEGFLCMEVSMQTLNKSGAYPNAGHITNVPPVEGRSLRGATTIYVHEKINNGSTAVVFIKK